MFLNSESLALIRSWSSEVFLEVSDLVLKYCTDPGALSDFADLAAERAIPGWEGTNSQIWQLASMADSGDVMATMAEDLRAEANAQEMSRQGLCY